MPIKGQKEVERAIIEHMKKEWEKVGPAWWDTVQENVMIPSLDEVPVHTGTLRATGQNILIQTPHTITCEVGYGSEAAPYALYVHENLAIHHPIHIDEKGEIYNCGGKAKFLEDPVNAAIPILPVELLKRLEGER